MTTLGSLAMTAGVTASLALMATAVVWPLHGWGNASTPRRQLVGAIVAVGGLGALVLLGCAYAAIWGVR